MAQFNKALKPFVRKLVEDRKKSILTARNIAQSLGYPMVRVGHTPMTHVPAQVRRKIRPSPPPQTTPQFVPEPAIDEAEYQHILKIIDDMSVMLERSPTAFERTPTMGTALF